MKTAMRVVSTGLGLLLVAGATMATTVKVANLQDLIDQSDRIFVGKCLTMESTTAEQAPLTRYTFQVIDPIKGVQDGTITIRQLGLQTPVQLDGGKQRIVHIPGMPRFEPGREFLLFMVKESPIGLSSPVGLGQGAFRVLTYGDKKSLVNENGNRNLGKGLSAAWLRSKGLSEQRATRLLDPKGGPLDYDTFVAALKAITATP